MSLCLDRDIFMRKAHTCEKISDFERAKKARNEANNLLDTCKKKHFDDQLNHNKNDPKCLWKVFKKLLPTKGVQPDSRGNRMLLSVK